MKNKILKIFLLLIVLYSVRHIGFSEVYPIHININESPVNFKDQEPFIDENDRTLVPVRFLSEGLDAKVYWFGDEKRVRILKNDQSIDIMIDSKTAFVNGTPVEMDTKAILVNNRTVVPLRFISEALGFDINYVFDQAHKIDVYNLELKLKESLMAIQTSPIDVTNFNLKVEEMNDIIDRMTDIYPDLYYLESLKYSYYEGQVKSVELDMFDTSSSLQEDYALMMLEVKSVIEEVLEPGMSDYEKEKALHDYLVRTVEYDEEEKFPYLAHTAYGALMNRVAVCDGYAEAFDLLLREVGIPSRLVYGQMSGENHAWNLVTIDDKKYFVDVTSNDPLNNLSKQQNYEFFNVPYEMISKTHIFEKDYSDINNYDANYFYKESLVFDDPNQINSHIYASLVNNKGEAWLYFMLAEDSLKRNIDLEKQIEVYLSESSINHTGLYSYTTYNNDLDYIYNVYVNVEKQ